MAAPVIGAATAASSAVATEWFVNTRFVIKPSGETRSNTAALSSDSDLAVQVDGSKIYRVKMNISVSSAPAADFKFSFTAPSGSALYGKAQGTQADAAFGVHWLAQYDGVNQFYNTTVAMATFGGGSSDFVELDAVLVTAGTAGTFALRWAQNVSDASNTTVRAGSWMFLRRVS